MFETGKKKIAVLFDADNAQPSIFSRAFAEINKSGTTSIRRAYGDWTTSYRAGWKDHLHRYAIQPVQQFSYTKGKNATDSALIIDAMDLLYNQKLDGFCLVSSDSDFTKLATRIRESGLSVMGMGETKTPQPFVGACDRFVHTEILSVLDRSRKFESRTKKLRVLIETAIQSQSKCGDRVPLGYVGRYIFKNVPWFDVKDYRHEKLSDLVESLDYLEVEKKLNNDKGVVDFFVRVKDKRESSQLSVGDKRNQRSVLSLPSAAP
jgi:uncharacterized LabA/DUF88 family protein